MAAERLRMTLADYVVLALNPTLVMGLVGTLVFFLLEVFYGGAYDDRVQMILFLFVVAIVLITRISLTDAIADRAGLYGLFLGALVYIGMQRFITYPEGSAAGQFGWLINLVLMAVVWWSAHCVTKDCTHMENDVEIGNQGLLDAAGVSGEGQGARGEEPEEMLEGKESKKNWLERYRDYREKQRRKKRTPGVWVVYFSLAALPLFGLGQALIPADAGARRQYTFLLLCLYVACGLGLLLTTAFLGLRRYLRQHGARMPVALTSSWLVTGMLLIVAFLAAAALLPRPFAEYSVIPSARTSSKTLESSKHGTSGENPGKDKGKPGADQKDSKTDESEKDGQGRDKGQKAKGKGEKDKGSGEDSKSDNGGQKNKDGKGGKSQEKKDGGQDKDSEQKKGDDQKSKEGDQKSDSGGKSPRSFELSEKFQGVAKFLKWVVFGILAAIVGFYLLRNGLRFLANFTDWARRLLEAWNAFWSGLFAQRSEPSSAVEEEEIAAPGPPPFAAFPNPFADGRAGRMTPLELVAYSFQALEAWSAERDLARADGETPLEFIRRIAAEAPAAEAGILRLGQLYVRAAYAPGVVPGDATQDVRRFWQALGKIGEGSLMA